MQLPRLTAAALYALGPLLLSCAGHDALAQDTLPSSADSIADARRSGEAMTRAIAALAPACTLGTARDAAGTWVGTARAEPETGAQPAQVYSLAAPVATTVIRFAVDRQGWRQIENVEARDAAGNWQRVWSGIQPPAPAQCDYVLFQQALGKTVDVGAIRLVFRRQEGRFVAGYVGVLKAPAQGRR